MSIKLIIWDMDGTLYPISADYKEACHKAAALAAMDLLEAGDTNEEVSYHDAYEMAVEGSKRDGVWYPTFCDKYGFSPVEFHNAHMERIDTKDIIPCQYLCAEIKNMTSVQHAILTHGNVPLAQDIMKNKLNISEVFGEHIYDLEFAEFNKKNDSFVGIQKILDTFGFEPHEAIMVDDSPSNLRLPKEHGMHTVFKSNGKDIVCEHADVTVNDTFEFIRDFNAGKLAFTV